METNITNKCKAFTSLEQSKKLAEILPIESADMTWSKETTITDGTEWYITLGLDRDITDDLFSYRHGYLVPGWSLSALLNVIPYNVSFNKSVYCFKLVKFPDHWECYHENSGMVVTEIFKADNPIDACYEMIINLHEFNML